MTAMNRRLGIVALAAFAAVSAASVVTARADGATSIPSVLIEFVIDHATFLSPTFARDLSRQLEDYQRGTGHQVIVWIDHTTGGVPIEDWTEKAFTAWAIGRKGHDDGVALFIFSDDRRARIAVGYGLEGEIPDARAGRIIENDLAPKVAAGDRDGGVKASVDALTAAIGGAPEPRRPAQKVTPLGALFPVLFFVVVLIIARRHPWALLLIGGRGGFGGGGFGGGGFGGGFSGGGGRTGGGGASGGW